MIWVRVRGNFTIGYKNVMANSKPLLSVIVPIYNVQDYVAAALQSLLEQSFTDFEAILVEDQSSDESLAIAQRFAQQDPRFRILQHETNQVIAGLAAARNTGNDSNCPGSGQSGWVVATLVTI